MSKKYFFKFNAGYTIIETMIAVSVFLIVITIGMGSLLNANLLHQKSRDLRSIMDNLSFVMEDMSRNIRTGYNYHCFASGDTMPTVTSASVSVPKSCASGWGIAFESATGDSTDKDGTPVNYDDQWVYYIGTDGLPNSKVKIYKSVQGPYELSSFTPLTPEEIIIDPVASSFSVLGAENPKTGDRQQPLVTIHLVGNITFKNVVTPFSLQTSVSQRVIDI